MSFTPTLPPISGFVETDLNGARVYRSVDGDLYISSNANIIDGDASAILYYNNSHVHNIAYEDRMITVDEATRIWLLLAASGKTEEAEALQTLINEAIEENSRIPNEE